MQILTDKLIRLKKLPLDTHPAIPPRNQENNFCFFCHFSCLSRADLVNHLGSAVVHVTAHRSFQTAFTLRKAYCMQGSNMIKSAL